MPLFRSMVGGMSEEGGRCSGYLPMDRQGGGGTLGRCLRMRRWCWMRTSLGHLTNRWRSFLNGSAPPMPNCFGLFSNSEFTTLSCNQTPTQPSQITRAVEIPSRSTGLGAVPLASSYVPRLQPLQPLFHIPTNIHNHQNQHYKLWLLIEHIINKTE